MADNKIKVEFQAVINKFQNDLAKVDRSMRGLTSTLKNTGKSLSKNVSAPLALVGGIALKQSMKFERLKTSLKVLTGSAEEGAIAFENLSKFSAKTPFQLDELAAANNKLMGFGLSASQSLESLKLLGDVAAVSGGDLNGMTVAFGQAAAEGRLMTRDIMQLVNNGVPAYKLLAEQVGVSTAEIRKMASDGEITFDILVGALQRATAEGGMFANGMEVLSGTLGGVTSTLRDNLSIAFAELGNEIVDAFDLVEVGKKLTTFIQGAIESFKGLDKSTKKMIIIVGGLAAAFGPLLVVVGTVLGPLAKGFTLVRTAVLLAANGFRALTVAMLSNPIGLIVTGIGLTVLALKELMEYLQPAVNGFTSLFNIIRSGGSYTKFLALQAQSAADNMGDMNEESSELETKLNDFDAKMKTAKSTLADFGKTTKGVKEEIFDLNKVLTEGVDADPTFESLFGFKDMIKGDYETAAFDPNMVDVAEDDPLDDVLSDEGIQRLQRRQQMFKELMEAIPSIVEQNLENGLMSMGQAIGDAMAGSGNLLQSGAAIIMDTIGNMAVQLGKTAISIGLTIKGIKAALKTLNPIAAIAAGVALVAVGSFFKNQASSMAGGGGGGSVPKFANGGIVSGPTLGLMGEYPGARSNPEVIAPLDKLKGMIGQEKQQVNVGGQFRVQGQDLVLALQRADKNRNRIL